MFSRWINRKVSRLVLENHSQCPQCGKTLPPPDSIDISDIDELLHCENCEWTGTLDHLISRDTNRIAPIHEQPRESKIALTIKPDLSRVYQIPAAKKLNALFYFSLLWLAFTGFFFFLALTSPPDKFSGASPLVIKSFVGIFPLVGISLLTCSLWMTFVSQEIRIRPKRSILSLRKCFGITLRKEIPINYTTKVRSVVAYEQNESPVHTVEIANSKKEKIRLSPQLGIKNLGWMLAQFENVLLTPEPETPYAAIKRIEKPKEPREYRADDLLIRHTGRESFVMTFSSKKNAFLMIFGLIFAGAGAFMIWDCISSFGRFSEKESDDFTKWFDLLFVIIPGLMGLIFFGIGTAIAGGALTTASRSRTISFAANHVTAGPELFLQKREKTWPKTDFDRVDLIAIGSSNDETRYSVKLLGQNTVLSLCRFRNIEQAGTVAAWAREWLHE